MPKIYRPKGGRPTKHEVRHKDSGRPTLMTPEVIAKLEGAFANGMTDGQACIIAGISKNTLYDYIQRNPNFGNRKEMLKQRVDIQAKKVIVDAINNGDTGTAKFWVERRCKDEFSTRQELTGTDGKQLMPPKIIISTNPIKNDEQE